MQIIDKYFESVLVIKLDQFNDNRGFFSELYQKDRYSKLGINDLFVQDNQSRSMQNVLRGLHYTVNSHQAQLMTVLNGKVFDVVVDLRENSTYFGNYKSIILEDADIQQIYIPPGFAHGFYVHSEFADLHYKTTKFYKSEDEAGIIWNDDDINIQWPSGNPIISDRDKNHPSLNEVFKRNT